jgi:hypothetical protein
MQARANGFTFVEGIYELIELLRMNAVSSNKLMFYVSREAYVLNHLEL